MPWGLGLVSQPHALMAPCPPIGLSPILSQGLSQLCWAARPEPPPPQTTATSALSTLITLRAMPMPVNTVRSFSVVVCLSPPFPSSGTAPATRCPYSRAGLLLSVDTPTTCKQHPRLLGVALPEHHGLSGGQMVAGPRACA
jgi:hypothetical protein